MRFTSTARLLSVKLELWAVTNSQLVRVSAVIISSTIPKLKSSCCPSPLWLSNGITTMDLAPKGLKVRFVRAAAAKANVVVDLYVVSLGTTDASGPRQTAVSIANYILNKIPD